MPIINHIINALIKLAFIAITLSLAVVPLIYIFGNEAVSEQSWHQSFQQLSKWQELSKTKQHPVSNIYLINNKTKLTWRNINSTLHLANYIQYELQKQEITVIKKIVTFTKPPNSPNYKNNIEVSQFSQLKQNPPLKWLKDIIEPYIGFEHQSAKHKHWIIVSFGDLESKFVNQIEALQKENALYKFIIVSVWPIRNKLIDAYPIPFLNATDAIQPQQQDESQETLNSTSTQSKNTKKQKRYKVKQIKQKASKVDPNKKSQQL